MELDIAVESVLTANAAVHAVLRRLVGRCDALVGHSTGEHSAAMAAGALDLDTDERLAAFCHGLYASYADAAGRHEVPAAVLLALGADARGRAADRAARPAASCSWRWTTARTRPCSWARPARPPGRASSPSARG